MKTNKPFSLATFTALALAQCFVLFTVFQFARGQGCPLEAGGGPFYSPSLKIEWDLGTNQLPSSFRVYKAAPREITASTISNLMEMASVTEPERNNVFPSGKIDPKNKASFQSADKYRSFWAVPAEGLLGLDNRRTNRLFGEHVYGVPSPKRASELGYYLLKSIGISSEEVFKTNCYSGTRGWSKDGVKYEEPCSMDVWFLRKLDGFEFDNQEVSFGFVDKERIESMSMRWIGLKPKKTYKAATKAQMEKWLKEGRGRVLVASTTGMGWVQTRRILCLRIKKITPHYYQGEDLQSLRKSDEVFPYAEMEAEADLPGSPANSAISLKVNLTVYCSIIDHALLKPIRDSESGFSVWP